MENGFTCLRHCIRKTNNSGINFLKSFDVKSKVTYDWSLKKT